MENEIRARVVAAALQAVTTVQERRLRDLKRIAESYHRVGVARLAFDDARAALLEMRAHLSQIAERAKTFEGRDYLTWNQQVVPGRESHYGQWMTRQVIGYALKYEADILRRLAELQDASRIFVELFGIAATDSFFVDSLADGPTGIAGYEAKMILYYALPLEERRNLASRLELRFDLRDVSPSGEFQDSPVYEHTILMDGYFFGALRNNAKGLLQNLSQKPEQVLGMGIDCSTFVQEVYERAGYPPHSFKSPISTESMIDGEMPGLQDGTFQVERLLSDNGLIPGDSILWPGHVQIFLGRDTEGRLRIAEAVGRRFKTVRESTLPLHEAGGRSVFENPERPIYVFRPRFN